MKLVIGNKRYSSWSLRPWLVMRAFDIPFEEIVLPLRLAASKEQVKKYSASGRVPALVMSDMTIWESMAIIEYLAESFPDRAIWPADRRARAHARAVANEMHGGFFPLRSGCPMDMGALYETPEMTETLARDVARIETIWQDARDTFGKSATEKGPFLFGAFSAADAMFAPVVSRFMSFQIPVSAHARAYMDAVIAHRDYAAWQDAALRETWTIPNYASEHTLVKSLLRTSETSNG